MPHLEYALEIAATPEQVYTISQDYAQRYQWDPFPEKIELLNGAKNIAIGTQVKIIAKSGLSMHVEFIQVSPPTVAAIKMIKGPRILKTFAGSWLFKELENSNTYAIFKYTIKTQAWSVPAISNRLVDWYFSRHIKARLTHLKHYCEQTLRQN